MYFEGVKLFNLEDSISELDNIFAHTKENEKEKLKDHMELVYKYFLRIIKEKNLDGVFENSQESLLKGYEFETVELWKELICNAVYLHDIGKINVDFQFIKMNNKKFKNAPQINAKHSMLSSTIYFNYYIGKIKSFKGEARKFLLLFLYINSYVISKHHGQLDGFIEFVSDFSSKVDYHIENKDLYPNFKDKINISGKFLNKISGEMFKELDEISKNKNVELYIYTKLMFALLTTADFYATSNYQSGKTVQNFGLIYNCNEYYDVYKSSKIYKGIEKHKNYLQGCGKSVFKDNDINKLRSEMFIEAEENLMLNKEKNIFYLEAPTGSGKTITSINLSFKLLEQDKKINKLFYIFPFNTLVEQTNTSLEEIFVNDEKLKGSISVINSITPIKTIDENEDNNEVKVANLKGKIDYESSLLNRQFIHYPIVLTTHISFFNYLFGTGREEGFPLVHLANSVVVLDEIQSYKNSIWKEIIVFLEKYAKLLNIKIIIMSATLPKLEEIGCREGGFTYLIKNREKYFNNPLFKDRVKLDFSLLDIEDDIEEVLFRKVIDESKINKKVVVEFISKKSAMNFYNRLIEESDEIKKEILLITGDDNKVERKKIIRKAKEKDREIIMVATQVIEAGVDIDMDSGFKDISILDSEEQFSGRINRACKKHGCKVYFFNMDEIKYIYKGDHRKNAELTLNNKEIREILLSKNFTEYYRKINNLIESFKSRENDYNFEKFITDSVGKLDFTEVQKSMKLIDDDKKEYTVFFDREIALADGSILTGEQVWDEYKILLKDNNLGYAEKKVKLSVINEKVDYFTYKVNRFENCYDDCIGEIFYIRDSEQYFNEGKFDRQKFNNRESYEIL